MKIQLPKKKTFAGLDMATLFMTVFDGEVYYAIKSKPFHDENGVEWNAVDVTTGEHLCFVDNDVVTELKGQYVVEG